MLSATLEVPVAEHAPAAAREFADTHLTAWDLDRCREQVLLVTSELVTNAIQHGKAPVTVRITHHDRCLRLEVSDSSAAGPVARRPGINGGFGLHLVNMLCTRWGTTLAPHGKVVWCECRLSSEHADTRRSPHPARPRPES